MAYSYVRYTGNGSLTNFVFAFPYLSPSHIKVRVDGTIRSYTLLNSNTVNITPAPADGAEVEIRRETPRDAPVVDFQDGSTLLESDLDLLATFNLYVSQEVTDAVDDGLFADLDGAYNADNRRIKNVANPIGAQDAATKNFVENGLTSQLNQASSLVNQATQLVNDAQALLSQITVSTLDPSGGNNGDIWFKVNA